MVDEKATIHLFKSVPFGLKFLGCFQEKESAYLNFIRKFKVSNKVAKQRLH
jgi:hypothetical protein